MIKRGLVLFTRLIFGVLLAFVIRLGVEKIPYISTLETLFNGFSLSLLNIIAALIGGFFLENLKQFKTFSKQKIFFSFGLLGTLSSFSGYIFYLASFFASQQFLKAFIFFALNNLLTLLAVFIGFKLASKLRFIQ